MDVEQPRATQSWKTLLANLDVLTSVTRGGWQILDWSE
jgi:hypothetical protein